MLKPSKTLILPTALEAVTDESLQPNSRGRIKCQGVYYKAEFYNTDFQIRIPKGKTVWVVALRGNLTLIVPDKTCLDVVMRKSTHRSLLTMTFSLLRLIGKRNISFDD